MGKRYWEDLTEGERFTCRPVAFDREGIVAFGKRYDPLPFHADEAAAARSIFGGAETDAVYRELKPFFAELRRLRPEATRKESFELYLLGKGYRHLAG